MDLTTSSLATTEKVSELNEEQADEKHEVQEKLSLPPEYDENDSRWTLKYRTPAEGLVELMEHSGVYVNAEKLAECEGLSSDSNKLAQLLLAEIFTVSALSTCSWPGANANATNIDGGHATPQLDEHATNILLKFVKEYAQLHFWELEDCHCIVKNLRQIMLQMREKIQRKTEILVLPPVNNQNLSRWTLKYSEPAEGLVELMENSGIYVNANKLGVCMKFSNDCVTLARMLLSEIFTTHALSTCSTKLMEQSETDNRFVLDEHAMSILLLFAVQYGYDKNWKLEGNEQTRIQDSIRQKMEVIRRVERKTVETHDYINYLPHITRWTLKYLKPASGLVELMEHSGVYVNAIKLAHCKEVSKDSVTLAQKLLTEVFNENALSTCSLSVTNNICYGLKTQFSYMESLRCHYALRHELDAYAEIVLLNFVDEYGLEQGFRVLDFQYIRNGMVERMSEISEEYAYKQKSLKILAPVSLMTAEENSSTNIINRLSQMCNDQCQSSTDNVTT